MVEAVDGKLRDIIPYENNPRRNEKAVDAVVNSIKQFGFKNPIIVDENMVIISGHTRRLAALKLSMETVPVIIAKDLTEEQVRAFRLADNRVASFSGWDEEKLKQEIGEINNIDLSDFGFKKDKIDDIFREKEDKKVHICPKCGHEWTES